MTRSRLLTVVLLAYLAGLAGCGTGSSSAAGDMGSAGATAACGAQAVCDLVAAAYGAGIYVAVGAGGASSADGGPGPWIEVSTDGVSWKPMDPGYTKGSLTLVVYGQAGFVATDGMNVIHSTDGRIWTLDSVSSHTLSASRLEYDGARYLLYTGGLGPGKVSTDGVNWSDYGSLSFAGGARPILSSIIQVNGTYYAVWESTTGSSGPNYLTASSPDGLAWTPSNLDASVDDMLDQLIYAGGRFVGFGGTPLTVGSSTYDNSQGLIIEGTDPAALAVEAPLSITGYLFSFTGGAYNGSVYVGYGSGGVFVSSDALTWAPGDLSGLVDEGGCDDTNRKQHSCFGALAIAAKPGGAFVLLGGGATGAVSTDGLHWSKSNL